MNGPSDWRTRVAPRGATLRWTFELLQSSGCRQRSARGNCSVEVTRFSQFAAFSNPEAGCLSIQGLNARRSTLVPGVHKRSFP